MSSSNGKGPCLNQCRQHVVAAHSAVETHAFGANLTARVHDGDTFLSPFAACFFGPRNRRSQFGRAARKCSQLNGPAALPVDVCQIMDQRHGIQGILPGLFALSSGVHGRVRTRAGNPARRALFPIAGCVRRESLSVTQSVATFSESPLPRPLQPRPSGW